MRTIRLPAKVVGRWAEIEHFKSRQYTTPLGTGSLRLNAVWGYSANAQEPI